MLRLSLTRRGFQNAFIQKHDRDRKVTLKDLEDLRNQVPNAPITETQLSDHPKRSGQVIQDQPIQKLDTRAKAALFRRDYLARGPTTPYLAQLRKNQLGIMVTEPGFINAKTMENVRKGLRDIVYHRPNINCQWNMPMPWKPRTRKPNGAVMGGGKGEVIMFETPIKARQILVEVYGKNMNYGEIYPYLVEVIKMIPVNTVIVNPQILQGMLREEYLIEEMNTNPYTFREVIEKNLTGSRSAVNKYDFRWQGKYR